MTSPAKRSPDCRAKKLNTSIHDILASFEDIKPPSNVHTFSSLSAENNSVNIMQDNSGNPAIQPPPNNPVNYIPPPRLSFIPQDEVKKFVGNRTSYDTAFSPGPTIEEFITNFNAFVVRHNLNNDEDKITALRMFISPSVGDARFTISSLLDNNINPNITFQEVIDYLKRAYKTTSSINFYRASQNFIKQCTPRVKIENDFLKLRAIELSCRELLEAYTEREAYTNSQKTPEEKLMELLTLTAFSAFAGEKISKKLSKDSVSARELLIRCREEIRINEMKDRQDLENGPQIENHVFFTEKTFPENAATKHPYYNKNNFNKTNSQRHSYQIKNNKQIVCHRCGKSSHVAKECRTTVELFCKKCLRPGHVSKVCFSTKQNFRSHD